MKKLGIIGAMESEVTTLKSKLTGLQVEHYAGMEFYTGSLMGLPAVVVQSGIGKVNASMCAQVLCARYNVTGIVNTGVAGSLCAELDIGDFVVSTDAVYHDFDCSPVNSNYRVGQVPGLPVWSFPADEKLAGFVMDAIRELGCGKVRLGTVASGDQFVSSKEKKEQIIAHTGALCTEMEGAAIAHTAWRNNVPFVVIRSISDKADDSAHMDYPSFEIMAAERCAGVTMALARKLSES